MYLIKPKRQAQRKLPIFDPGYGNVETRLVEDGGVTYFEVGYHIKEQLFGSAATHYTNADKTVWLSWEYAEVPAQLMRLQYNPDNGTMIFAQIETFLTHWHKGRFVNAPVHEVVLAPDHYVYWARCLTPHKATTTTPKLVCWSDAVTGDLRNNPITGITIDDEALTLPNAPYTLPADAAQLQTDLAAIYPGSTVTASSATVWEIAIPGVTHTDYDLRCRVHWASYLKQGPEASTQTYVDGREFLAADFTLGNVRCAPFGCARLAIDHGLRYGFSGPRPTKQLPYFQPAELRANPSPIIVPLLSPTSAPYLAVDTPRITGSPVLGGTLTRPTYVWLGEVPVTVTSSEWYKNGVPTGITTATYADTADGDTITYRETATNANGASTHSYWPAVYVSTSVAVRRATANAEIDDLIDGLPGGALNMNIFTSQNHPAGTYVRNPDLWAAPLIPQLCAAVALKYYPGLPWNRWEHPMQSFGGILITPRHVLYCHHSHPHAQGTWSILPNNPSAKLRWVKPDNSVVEATQIMQTSQAGLNWPPQMVADAELNIPGFLNLGGQSVGQGSFVMGEAASLDLCVATLDQDMTTLGIPVMPIMRVRTIDEYTALSYGDSGEKLPVFDVSQGCGRQIGFAPPQPISDYPQYNQTMVVIGPRERPANSPQAAFDYSVWDGDSGTPTFVLHDGTVYLEGIMLREGWSRISPGLFFEEINQMIAASDAGAVALGRLAQPTGLTVTPVALPTI